MLQVLCGKRTAKRVGQLVKAAHQRSGRPRRMKYRPPDGLVYATLHNTRRKGRVVKVEARLQFGTAEDLEAALAASPVSNTVNTSFIERHNGTDRHRNSRKVRKTYRFSKDVALHQATTYFTMYSYNFCWPVRTLREEFAPGRYRARTPAMAAACPITSGPSESGFATPPSRHKAYADTRRTRRTKPGAGNSGYVPAGVPAEPRRPAPFSSSRPATASTAGGGASRPRAARPASHAEPLPAAPPRAPVRAVGGRGGAWLPRPARSTQEQTDRPARRLRPEADPTPEGSEETRRAVCPSHPQETAQMPMAHFA